jgi:allophycocyanin alpha subunit
MSILMSLIAKADAEVRYLTPGELEQIKQLCMNGDRRLRLAQSLTQNRERIVKQSSLQLFQKRRDLVSPGGNAYGKEMTATCLRDMDYYLRLITYSVVAGDTAPIQQIGVIGVREMYRSLGTPIEAVAESVRGMKNLTTSIMSAEDASEVGAYFDYLIGAMQ